MNRKMAVLVLMAAIALVVGPHATNALADDAADPVGTWEWSFETQSGQLFEMSVKIEKKDDKLAGVFTGPRGDETPVEDLKLEGDNVTFQDTRERNGQEFVASYEGKLSADEIKGSMSIDFGGQSRERDWEAKRAVELTGTWNLNMTTPDGRMFDNVLKLQQQDGTLGGTITGRRGESELQDVRVDGAKLTFNVVRERDGQEFVMKYSGELKGDKLAGIMEIDFGGQAFEIEFEGTRSVAEEDAGDAAESEE